MDNVEASIKLVQMYADFRRHFNEFPPYAEAVALAIAALSKVEDGEG